MKAPCKNCEKRYRGCHDRCEQYQTFKAWGRKVYEASHKDLQAKIYEIERNAKLRKDSK